MSQHLFHLLNKVELATGVIEGSWASATAGIGAAGLGVTVDKGMSRVGPTATSVAAMADKAEPGLNVPGARIQYDALTVNVPDAQVSLVWLKTNGTLAATADLAAGQSLADVAPELTPDPNSGAMINGTNVSQKGPLRQQQPASVLIARVTAAGGAITKVDNTVQTRVLM
jgi:hypothetical protein